jgi:hypothetical protein
MSNELARSLPLLLLFTLGLAAGIWIFVAPWAVGYPTPNGWTASVWASVWTGAILAAASSISLIVVLAHAAFVTVRRSTGM